MRRRRPLLLLLAFLLAAPLQAALTVRYADFDLATGSDDGTSEANAWQSWTTLLAGMAAGQCINIQQTGTRNAPGDQVFAADGSDTQPVYLVGYKTTPSDCGATTWGDGTSSTENYFQFGDALKITGDNYWVRYIDILENQSFGDQAAFKASGRQIRVLNCIVENTNTGNGSTGAGMGSYNVAINNLFKWAPGGTSSAQVLDLQTSSSAVGNRVDLTASTSTGAPIGIRGVGGTSNLASFIWGNVIRGPDASGGERGILLTSTSTQDDRTVIGFNSMADLDEGIHLNNVPNLALGTITILGNAMHNVNDGIISGSAAADNRGLDLLSNAIDSNTADYSNIGDKPLLHAVTLSTDAFTDIDNWDPTLNATAGGGLSCVDVAAPVDIMLDGTDHNTLDIGAMQDGQ